MTGTICAALTGLSLAALPGGVSQAAVTDTDPSFEVSAADLRFILKQIKISESHPSDGDLLCADETDTTGTCVPHPLLPWGLRTVDGRFNNLMPGQSTYGAADQPFPRVLDEYNRQAESAPAGAPPNPPGATDVCADPATTCYAQNGNNFVYDSDPRTISNLIVDQTTANPAAVAAAGRVPGSGPTTGDRLFIPNESPDVGLSAPFNSWFTLFGQFFDHGLDLVDKGGNGTVVIPLKADDDLFVAGSQTNFMMLTRATVVGEGPKGRLHNNETTPFVDQNQTYTSHPSHQVFLREYTDTPSGPVSSGKLLDGASGGLASWTEVKAATAARLGIALTDQDVLNVPQVLVDFYGQFIPGPNGYPQVVFPDGADADADPDLVEGNPAAPVSVDGSLKTDHAFLDDIAHNAVPDANYDAALLGKHFITGDGRGNENIGLTAVHHVFHAEHNRITDRIQEVLDANPALKAGYEGAGMPGEWTYGDRVFQAARYVTEMEYQHLVFEEFARTIQPAIDAVPFNESTYHSTINSAIPAEFAHTVYRFGHSMLTDTIDRRGFGSTSVSLFDGFLNPDAFTQNGLMDPDQAAGSIINGMVGQTGNGIDEFVDDTLRNQLLGLPLDLPAINIARARDAGVPPLQAVRALFFQETADTALKPYDNWRDFGNGLKNPESLVNFIAAYGTHATVTAADTVAAKRAAAQALVTANDPFLTAPAAESGLNDVDFWVGGLAEKGMPFGGMLGTTFNQVFEATLENLQNGDRFYYLNRNIGLNLFHQLEANSFSALVQRTTAASEVPANIFASQDSFLYDLEVIVPSGVLPPEIELMTNGTYRYVGPEHIQFHGQRTAADKMRADEGDDFLWGYGGADRMEGGAGNDAFIGGAGDDILTDIFGTDNFKGSKGNDAIHAGPGDGDLIHGGAGKDFIVHGSDLTQSFAGQGDDFILGGTGRDTVAANEGDDWIETLGQADLVQGDNANGFQDDPYGGNDVMLSGPGNDDYDSEGGDDIMVTDPGTDRHEGMLGFDWVTHKNDPNPAQADMDNTVFQPPSVQNMRDRYDLVEGLSGWNNDDVLRGVQSVDVPPSILANDVCADFGRPAGCTGHELTEAHLDMVSGLRDLLGSHTAPLMSNNTTNDLIIGGQGSDLIEGRGGDDFIDGSAWLNVRLSHNGQSYESLRDLQNGVFADPQTINPGDITIVREILSDPATDGINTAVYSDVADNYTVTDNGDGTFTVAHDGGTGADGTDVIRNIDRLLFADGGADVVPDPVDPQPVNTPASGVVALSSTTPTEGVALTADPSGIVDPDGIDQATLTLTWEAGNLTDGFVAVGAGDTFTPAQAQVGLQLRVVATFTDQAGVTEQVVSDLTSAVADDPALGNPDPVPDPDPVPVNAPATGAASLSAATTGTALRVATDTIADPDGVGTLSIQWQRQVVGGDFADIAGAQAASLPLTDAVRGATVRAVVSFVDNAGNPERVVSEAFTVPRVAPSAPRIQRVVAGVPGGVATARVAWRPQATGGAPITRYVVVAAKVSPKGLVLSRTTKRLPGTARAVTMRLKPGVYRFLVRAGTSVGTSKSAVSAKVRAR